MVIQIESHSYRLGVLCIGHYIDSLYFSSLLAGLTVIVLGTFALMFHVAGLQMSVPLVVNLKREQQQVRFELMPEKQMSMDNTQYQTEPEEF